MSRTCIGGRNCDDVLCRRALANIKKYGKPIPADVLYGEPEDETAGEDKGAARWIGRHWKKLVNHTTTRRGSGCSEI